MQHNVVLSFSQQLCNLEFILLNLILTFDLFCVTQCFACLFKVPRSYPLVIMCSPLTSYSCFWKNGSIRSQKYCLALNSAWYSSSFWSFVIFTFLLNDVWRKRWQNRDVWHENVLVIRFTLQCLNYEAQVPSCPLISTLNINKFLITISYCLLSHLRCFRINQTRRFHPI